MTPDITTNNRTFWTSLSGVVAGIGGVATGIYLYGHPVPPSSHPDVPASIATIVTGLSAILGNLGSVFARSGAKREAIQTSLLALRQHEVAVSAPVLSTQGEQNDTPGPHS